MMRWPLMLCAVTMLAGCAHWYEDDTPQRPASVETRRVPGATAQRTSVERTRIETPARDASEADLRRMVERQSKRIAELEARPAEGEAQQAVELIAYGQRLAAMGAEEQKRELAAASQANSRESSLYSRVRLALVLAAPGSPVGDDARAASLLESIASQPARTPLRQLAALVHGLLQERVREQRRVAQLREQIDGLRAIERSLMDREQGRAQ
jgi:hypothetical protein